ncbi:MAG TPA: HAD family hydrolase [Rectinemataceae bacterium]
MAVDFVWFDLGYTLLYKDRERLFESLLSEVGQPRSYDDIDRAFHHTDKLFMRKFPGYLGRSAREFMPLYFGFLCKRLDIRGDLVSLLNRWMDAWGREYLGWKAYPWVPEVLDGLAAAGFRLGVISNWDESARGILADCGILDKFSTVVISSEVGVSKPDPEIFRIALERAGAEASRSIYVGDNYYDDAVGAQAVGMKSLIINRFGDFGVEELSGCRIIADIREVAGCLEEDVR